MGNPVDGPILTRAVVPGGPNPWRQACPPRPGRPHLAGSGLDCLFLPFLASLSVILSWLEKPSGTTKIIVLAFSLDDKMNMTKDENYVQNASKILQKVSPKAIQKTYPPLPFALLVAKTAQEASKRPPGDPKMAPGGA